MHFISLIHIDFISKSRKISCASLPCFLSMISSVQRSFDYVFFCSGFEAFRAATIYWIYRLKFEWFFNRIMIILQFDSTNFFHWFRKVLTIWFFLLENIATLLALPFLHCLYGVWLKQMIFLKKNKWSKQILFKWIQCDEIKILCEKFSLRELENYFLHGHF